MTPPPRFVSFGQNGEDVVLNRVLGDIVNGIYIEVGANHPRYDSISRSFYDRGWHGIAVEPNSSYAALFRRERPRDFVIEAAITPQDEGLATLHLIDGTGLSTLIDTVSRGHSEQGFQVRDVSVPTRRLDSIIVECGLEQSDLHFLMIDTEGAEPGVLESIDLTRFRPWILIIESTAPGSAEPTHESWEPRVLAAGYQFCLFDGVSRFYVANEKSEFRLPLSRPASAIDNYLRDSEVQLRARLDSAESRADRAEGQIEALIASKSWQLTRPLRAIWKRFTRES